MERELDNINFSSNDGPNVFIPDTLGALTCELMDTFVLVFKGCAMKNEASVYLAQGVFVGKIFN